MKPISVDEVKYLAFELAAKHLTFDEPIPDFSTRTPHVLESCLLTPFQRFSGKSLYPSLVSRAAILLYLMIKNHPFINGNKRIAITTLLAFLFKNGKWLEVDAKEFYNFTIWIAMSPAGLKEHVVAGAEKFIRMHIVNLSTANT